MSRLAEDLLEAAIARGVTVTAAESCTGGMISAAITDIAGSSAIFERGFVTYSNVAKTEMLGVSEATLAARGAVSEEVAREMADGARQAAGADFAVAVTGIAGPGGSEHKPEGRVCFALADHRGTRSETVEFGAIGRGAVRAGTRDHALGLLLAALRA
ncbi:nicotinamide-nucleotide amidase [Roseivivax lentus]|uniref:Nicotinamide-nucleotide amidase n=1 Tax=Roseivivax lentus TaxID=633194 RepID=A0A1N7LRZ9_9RHOB|nr:nicotinamide-nucleotide amidohydrolase family protein [Roseivivax lentus]SIS76606.1 nicotinamide-nucleotide amidase [Roseivivax lentus]